MAKIALLRLPPPKPIRAEPAAEVAELDSLLADNEAESAFAEVLGATDLDWQDTDEEKRSPQSATVADDVGDEVVSSKLRSKALAPPTSTAPEPSPFEVAMKTLAAKPTRIVSRTSLAQPPPKPVPAAASGGSPPTPRGGWQIAFEDHTAAEATPLVRTPLVRIERSVAEKSDEPKGRKIQEFDLGDAVLTMMELDDEDAIPLEERLTLSMDDRETTRPPVPAAPPLDAYPPQLRPPTPNPEEQRGAEEPVIVLARTKSFTPAPTPSSASGVSDSTERSESPRPVSVSQRARDAALPARDEPRRAVPPTRAEPSRLRRVAGVVGTAMATAAAFGVSFTMVRAFQTPSASETTASGPDPSAAPVDESAAAVAVNPAVPEPSSSSAAPAVAQATLKLSDNLDLPADLTVAGDKGLLEVNTEGQHSIYVDGVFVGRGPVRRMPLVVGTHEIRLTLDGAEERYSANVHAGKRTLLGASKPEP